MGIFEQEFSNLLSKNELKEKKVKNWSIGSARMQIIISSSDILVFVLFFHWLFNELPV